MRNKKIISYRKFWIDFTSPKWKSNIWLDSTFKNGFSAVHCGWTQHFVNRQDNKQNIKLHRASSLLFRLLMQSVLYELTWRGISHACVPRLAHQVWGMMYWKATLSGLLLPMPLKLQHLATYVRFGLWIDLLLSLTELAAAPSRSSSLLCKVWALNWPPTLSYCTCCCILTLILLVM